MKKGMKSSKKQDYIIYESLLQNKIILEMTNDTKALDFLDIATVASNAGIGPKIIDAYSNDEKLLLEMEKVRILKPQKRDDEKILLLYRRMIKHKMVAFDSVLAKNKRNKWVLYDFSKTELYESEEEALKAALENDIFGNLHPRIKEFFERKFTKC